jgi:hypothetical protein
MIRKTWEYKRPNDKTKTKEYKRPNDKKNMGIKKNVMIIKKHGNHTHPTMAFLYYKTII